MFKKLAVMMNKDSSLKSKTHKLFLESTDLVETTKIIVNRQFEYELTETDSQLMLAWFKAYFNKQSKRKAIPFEIKKKLFDSQNGKCAACGESLGNDFSKIHVDHIVPWSLVGDELPDNYQVLCQFCNESKSANTDYIFKKLIKLN